MKIKVLERKILFILFAATDELLAFTLYRKLGVPPGEFYLAIESLIKAELITFRDDERISLTRNGEGMLAVGDVFPVEKVGRFDKIPESLRGPKIGLNDFYIPRADLFD